MINHLIDTFVQHSTEMGHTMLHNDPATAMVL